MRTQLKPCNRSLRPALPKALLAVLRSFDEIWPLACTPSRRVPHPYIPTLPRIIPAVVNKQNVGRGRSGLSGGELGAGSAQFHRQQLAREPSNGAPPCVVVKLHQRHGASSQPHACIIACRCCWPPQGCGSSAPRTLEVGPTHGTACCDGDMQQGTFGQRNWRSSTRPWYPMHKLKQRDLYMGCRMPIRLRRHRRLHGSKGRRQMRLCLNRTRPPMVLLQRFPQQMAQQGTQRR